MASRAADKSLADFIAGALNPPLIMALVGSLVFFLQEVLYEGLYSSTLRWVLFFFVFGAVLIARMSMNTQLASKSWAYGLVLGGLVWLALKQYVDYSEHPTLEARSGFLNLGLIALIWWSAHRLTLDCTFLSEETGGQAAGAGLLDAAGLDKAATPGKPEEEPKKAKKSKKKTPEEQPGLEGWWARYLRYREERKKRPQTLGVWVVFFSLAALPLFGLGQAQIPAAEVERRSHAFSLLLIYVAAGLGLLLTTSFLTLRAYLRERGVTMPAGITLGWLVLGGLLIVGHLLVSGMLPPPTDPQPLWDWTGMTQAKAKDPSRWSPMREKGNQKRGSLKEGQSGQAQTTKDAANKRVQGNSKTQSKSGKSSDQSKAGKENGEQKSKDAESGDKKGDNNDAGKEGERKEGEDQEAEKKDADNDPADQADGGSPPSLPEIPLTGFMEFARWIVVAAVVLAVVFVVGRVLLQFLANFTLWARKLLGFFDNLFARDARQAGGARETAVKRPPPRPFSSYGNPFDNGRAKQMSAAEMVGYSFAALEAWGREHELARGDGETAMEYALRIGLRHAGLGEECRKIALLYARLAYSTDTLAEVKIGSFRVFWMTLCNMLEESRKVETADDF